MATSPSRRARRRSLSPLLLLGCGLALLTALAILRGVYVVAENNAAASLLRDAKVTAQLQAAALESELEKQRIVPTILAGDADLRRALIAHSREQDLAISDKLANLTPETPGTVIYVLDREGEVRSASNYKAPESFVGSHFAFRRYFIDALIRHNAEEFAAGAMTGHAGLFIAHAIRENARSVGVAVVKVEFDTIEASWRASRAKTVVTDAAGKILLTSEPDLRFRALSKPPPDQLAITVPVDPNGWRLTLTISKRDARFAAQSDTLIAFLVLALCAATAAWLWRRHRLVAEQATAEAGYRVRLEADVAARTSELSQANERLSAEIQERLHTERRLNDLQADLVQANKLAQLGQITAGVAHEMNQPLATIRVLAESSLALLDQPKARRSAMVRENLGVVVRMCERISHITSELRAFSRKATGATRPVSVKRTLDSSILLNKSRLRHNRVRLLRDPIDPTLEVIGGQIRLEQVFVNLLQNAFEALEDAPDPIVRIGVAVQPNWVWVNVRDNGPGLPDNIRAHLFTPFVTSKETGLGLGLVIARDIVREFGGELTAESSESGAVFSVKLKRVSNDPGP